MVRIHAGEPRLLVSYIYPLSRVQSVHISYSDGKARPHPGQQQLPAHLPRVEQSEQLDVEPARYFVAVTKREKRACPDCAQGVITAAVPERIVEKGLVSDRVVIDTLVAKYSDHVPLYRQSLMLERDTGISISRATMDGWVMRIGDLLIPIAAATGRELLAGGYIQADETPVPVQMHDGPGKNHQTYLWQYGRGDFRMGRGREGPLKFLGHSKASCKPTATPRTNAQAGCGEAQPRRSHCCADGGAHRRTVCHSAMRDHATRHGLRQERSGPLLDLLRSEIAP